MPPLLKKYYMQILLGVVAIWVALAAPNSQKIGDRLQYAIPIVGLACSFELKEAGDYFLRYALGLGAVHAFKNGLPDEGINLRPDGGGNGFPSGHTYSATYGASYLVRQCSQRVPYLGTIAAVAASYTAVTRVESGKHSSFQVLFGMIFGVFFDQIFRKNGLRSILARYFSHARKKN